MLPTSTRTLLVIPRVLRVQITQTESAGCGPVYEEKRWPRLECHSSLELTFLHFLSKLSEPFTRETKSRLGKKVDRATLFLW